MRSRRLNFPTANEIALAAERKGQVKRRAEELQAQRKRPRTAAAAANSWPAVSPQGPPYASWGAGGGMALAEPPGQPPANPHTNYEAARAERERLTQDAARWQQLQTLQHKPPPVEPAVAPNAAAAESVDLCCDTCDTWYTTAEVGLSVQQAQALDEWHCGVSLGTHQRLPPPQRPLQTTTDHQPRVPPAMHPGGMLMSPAATPAQSPAQAQAPAPAPALARAQAPTPAHAVGADGAAQAALLGLRAGAGAQADAGGAAVAGGERLDLAAGANWTL